MSESDELARLRERVIALERRCLGLYRALLVDSEDPEKRGRLRLLVPEVLGEIVSGWAEPCVPYGGVKDAGSYAIPPLTKDKDGNPTTALWVTFRGGSVRYPVWLGTSWGAPGDVSDAPGDASADLHTQDPKVVLKDFAGNSVTLLGNEKTPKVTITNTDKTGSVAQTITLNGAGSDAWISIADNQNNTITLDKTGIEIKSVDNNDTIKLDSNGVKVEGANITLTGSATIKATGNNKVTVEGAQIEVKASAKVSVTGASQVEVSSSGQVKIEGSMVIIN